MALDAHMHLRPVDLESDCEGALISYTQSVIEKMERAGVGGGILASNTMEHDQLDIVTRRFSGHFLGLLNMVPDMSQNLADIEKYGDNPNIVGIKIYPNLWEDSKFSDDIQPVLDEIEGRRWFIQVHSNPVVFEEVGLPLQVRELAWKAELPVVMVHCGGHQFMQVYGMLGHIPENLYFDTSAIQNIFCDSPARQQVRWLFERLGERVFWASDYPGYTFEAALSAVEKYEFSSEKLIDLRYRNCVRFLEDWLGEGLLAFTQS